MNWIAKWQRAISRIAVATMVLMNGIDPALAEEGGDVSSSAVAPSVIQDSPASAAGPSANKLKPRTPKGKPARDKEADGSEARDRFQADTVIKSKYELNGEPLEVDPD